MEKNLIKDNMLQDYLFGRTHSVEYVKNTLQELDIEL